jgi:predicted nucleotidyltransferase
MQFMNIQALTQRKLDTILAELREQFDHLYGPRLVNLVLYGSQARGDAEFGSDIDVLVILEGPVEPYREIERATPTTAALSLKHDVVISCVYISAERYSQEKSPFLLNVHREGVIL